MSIYNSIGHFNVIENGVLIHAEILFNFMLYSFSFENQQKKNKKIKKNILSINVSNLFWEKTNINRK